jgi:hypothetical protein
MRLYKAEKDADLQFEFPDELIWDELDKQGVKLPVKMKLVDIVIEREKDVLLVEIKDPSNSNSTEERQGEYLKRLLNNSVLAQDLTPKARDSYTYLHLMARDSKPFKYVVLLGVDVFDQEKQKAVLTGFKDRLLASILCESFEAWKRVHIADCVVMSVQGWNDKFPAWPVTRLGAAAT